MFTIKLYRGHTMRLLQAESVQIFAAGPATKMADEVKDRTNDVREIALSGSQDGSQVFYVSKAKCWANQDNPTDVYNYAYIENALGATTEKVYPY